MMMICTVESIKPTGTDRMFEATLTVKGHGAAIKIIGMNLTETVERTYIVLKAFNGGK